MEQTEDSFIFRKGTKYYKFLGDGTADIIRIVNIKSRGDYVCMHDEDYTGEIDHSKTFIVSQDKLREEYRLLLPNGQICLLNVQTSEGASDVMLVAIKINSDDNSAVTAAQVEFSDVHVVCRQVIPDVFEMMIRQSEVECYGISVSIDTCPANIPFQSFYNDCKPAGKGQFVNIYQQDNMDQILGLFKLAKSDEILKWYYDQYNDPKNVGKAAGVERCVEDLVKHNGFMYDIQNMFGIMPMPGITIKYTDNMYVLNDQDISKLEYAIKRRMSDILIVPCNHFVAESKLSKDYSYVKISDSAGAIYIIQYKPLSGFDESLYPDECKDGFPKLSSKLLP